MKAFNDFRFEDFTLADYDPHPVIKAPIAVSQKFAWRKKWLALRQPDLV